MHLHGGRPPPTPRQVLSALRHPRRTLRRLRSRYYSLVNYRAFRSSGHTAITGDLPYQVDAVREAIQASGIAYAPLTIDVRCFEAYMNVASYPQAYVDGTAAVFREKALEHFLSLELAGDLGADAVVLDAASAGSPFPAIAHQLRGCQVVSNDLAYPPGVSQLAPWHRQHGGSACALPLPDGSLDLIVLHCALEMFEGEDDMDLVTEAARVLKPGGKLIIIPLYMNETHHVLRDPRTSRRELPAVDPGAELVYRDDFYELAFARFYSVDALSARLLSRAEDFDVRILEAVNARDVDPICYLRWIAVFERKG